MNTLNQLKKEYYQVRLEQLLLLYDICGKDLDKKNKWKMVIEIILLLP